MKYFFILLVFFFSNKQDYIFYNAIENTFEYSQTKHCRDIKIFDSYGNEVKRIDKCNYRYFPITKGRVTLYVKKKNQVIDTIHGNVMSVPDFKIYLVRHFTYKNNFKPNIASNLLDKEGIRYELIDYEIKFKNKEPILYSDSLFRTYLFKSSYAEDTLTISKIYVKINNIMDTINVNKKFTLRSIQDRH